jgi:hypothetical protein
MALRVSDTREENHVNKPLPEKFKQVFRRSKATARNVFRENSPSPVVAPTLFTRETYEIVVNNFVALVHNDCYFKILSCCAYIVWLLSLSYSISGILTLNQSYCLYIFGTFNVNVCLHVILYLLAYLAYSTCRGINMSHIYAPKPRNRLDVILILLFGIILFSPLIKSAFSAEYMSKQDYIKYIIGYNRDESQEKLMFDIEVNPGPMVRDGLIILAIVVSTITVLAISIKFQIDFLYSYGIFDSYYQYFCIVNILILSNLIIRSYKIINIFIDYYCEQIAKVCYNRNTTEEDLRHDVELNPGPHPKDKEITLKSIFKRTKIIGANLNKVCEDLRKITKEDDSSTADPKLMSLTELEVLYKNEHVISDFERKTYENMRQAAIVLCVEAKRQGNTKQEDIMRHIIDDMPITPQMFSLPTVNLAVDQDTQKWFDEALNKGITIDHNIPLLQCMMDYIKAGASSPFLGIALIVIVSGLTIHAMQGSITTLATGMIAVATAAAYLYYGNTPVVELIEYFTKSDKPIEGVFEPQMFDAFLNKETLVSLLIGSTFFATYGINPTASFTSIVSKHIGNLSKYKSGTEAGFDMILSVITSVMQFIGTAIGNDSMMTYGIDNPKISELSIKLNQIINDLRNGSPQNACQAQLVFRIEAELRDHLAMLKMSKENSIERQVLNNLLRTAESIAKNFTNCVRGGPRVQPVGVLIHGPPGVGKSITYMPTLAAVAANVMSDEQWQSFQKNREDCYFNYMPETGFWEGYHNQWAVLVDEAGQMRDSSSNPDPQVFSLIRMINTNPYTLDMAHCDLKGAITFNSKIIYGTTNVRKWDLPSIYDGEAYARRWTIEVLQVPKLIYCTDKSIKEGSNLWDRRLDPVKLPYVEEGFEVDTSDYFPYNGFTGEVIGAAMDHKQFVDFISKEYVKNEIFGEKVLSYHSVLIDNLNTVRNTNNKYLSALHSNYQPQSNFPVTDDQRKFIDKMNSEFEISGDIVDEWNEVFDAQGINRELGMAHVKHNMLQVKNRKEFYNSFYKNMGEQASNFWEATKEICFKPTFIAGAVAALGIAACAWKFLKPVFVAQSGKTNVRVKHIVPKTLKTHEPVVPQARFMSKNTDDMCNTLWQKSVYSIKCRHHSEIFGYVIMIGSRICTFNTHFRDCIKSEFFLKNPDLVLVFTRVCGSHSFEVLYSEIDDQFVHIEGDPEDLIYCQFRKHHTVMHRDIRNYIISEEDPIIKQNFYGALLRRNSYGSCLIESTFATPLTDFDYGYLSNSSCSYPIVTQKGECGLPFVVSDSRCPLPKLAFIHAAGDSSKCGIGIAISKQSADAAFKYFNSYVAPDIDITSVDMQSAFEENLLPPQFDYLGEIEPISMAANTNIVRAPLYGLIAPVEDFPVHLSTFTKDGVKIDPFVVARKNYCIDMPVLNMKLLHLAVSYTTRNLYNGIKGMDRLEMEKPAVWTYEHAVLGDNEFNCISRGNSSGYPWNIKNKKKSAFFGKDGEFTFKSVLALELKSVIDAKIDILSSGNIPSFIFHDFLKDETRTKDKARLVSSEPCDLGIITRMYFGDFMKFVYNNRITNGISVGINPYSTEWKKLSRYITSVGDRVIAGDHAKWDGRFTPALFQSCLEVVEEYYTNSTEEERTIRRMIIESLIHSEHIMHMRMSRDSEGNFSHPENDNSKTTALQYMWFGSIPSGCTLTSIFGSLGNGIITRYSIYNHLLKGQHLKFSSFSELDFNKIEDNLRINTFGDDNLVGIGSELEVNQQDLTESFAMLGYEYTDEQKGSAKHTYRSIKDVTYLKRTFVEDSIRGITKAPLAIDSIRSMVNWQKDKALSSEYELSIRTAICEYSLHDREVFETEGRKLINLARSELGYHMVPNTYDQVLELCLNLDALHN